MEKTERKYWNKLYVFVLLFLFFQIVLYYFITQYFQQ